MDTRAYYRQIIEEVLSRYASLRPSHGDIRVDVVFDEVRDRYALMQTGWDRGRRVRGSLAYLTLEEDRVIIEYDGIGYGIVDDLIAGGIPKEKIVLAYLPTAEAVPPNSQVVTG
ncbi:MAG TPA: XisI protein [Caldilineaceae bacterium]|nr:XisI protein [Caldilineaceae bacterium]